MANRVGRPKKIIDYEKVFELAALYCTQKEIATALHIDVSTLARDAKFHEVYDDGIAKCKISIRRMQYATAKRGSAHMQEYLGKQILGQADKIETKNDDRVTIVIESEDAKV